MDLKKYISLLFYFVTKSTASERPIPLTTESSYYNSFSEEEWRVINNKDYLLVPPVCTPVQVNAVFRHAANNPSESDTLAFEELADKVRESATGREFRNYDFPYYVDDADRMHDAGRREMMKIGQRLLSRYKNLLKNADESELLFTSSARNRTLDSVEPLAEGLGFDGDDIEISERDDLMRFYDDCPRLETVAERFADQQVENFKNGEEMEELVEDVNAVMMRRDRLDADEILLAYELAGNEDALLGSSVWTNLFTREQLETLEYLEDLSEYWEGSSGFHLTKIISCPLLRFMITSMNAARDLHHTGTGYKKGIFQIGHGGTILPLAALVGVNVDNLKPLASNFAHQGDRKFKGHRVGPHSANLALVLYECSSKYWDPDLEDEAFPNTTWPEKLDTYMVQILYNEIPIRFPFAEHHLVSFDVFRDQYPHVTKFCSRDAFCRECPEEEEEEEVPYWKKEKNGVNAVSSTIIMFVLGFLITIVIA